MMKKLVFAVFAAAMLACGVQASAQVIAIGAGYSNSVNRTSTTGDMKADYFNGFNLGITYGFPIAQGVELVPGIQYEYLMKNKNWIVIKENDTDHYLNVPLHFKLNFDVNPTIRFFVQAGPTFSVGLASSSRFQLIGNTDQMTYDNYAGQITSSTEGLIPDNLRQWLANASPYMGKFVTGGSEYQRFDVLLGGAVGVDFSKMLRLKVGYDFGMVNRFSNDFTDATRHRQRFYAGLAYLF